MASGAQCAAGTCRLWTNACCSIGIDGARRKKTCNLWTVSAWANGVRGAMCRRYVQAVAKCGVGSNAIEGASRRKDLQVVDSPSMGEWRQARNVPPVRAGCGQMRYCSNAIECASCKKDLQVVDSPSMGEKRMACNVPLLRASCGQTQARAARIRAHSGPGLRRIASPI